MKKKTCTTLIRNFTVPIALLLASNSLYAGPWFSFKNKINAADAIVEVHLPVTDEIPGSGKPATLKRVLLNRTGHAVTLPETIFNFSRNSACWRTAKENHGTTLIVFLQLQKQGKFKQAPLGVENEKGAYTQFNQDYPKIIAALSSTTNVNNPYSKILSDSNAVMPRMFYQQHCN